MTASSLYIQLTILLMLLVFSAVFSASETALMSIGRIRVRQLLDDGVPGAEAVNRLVQRPNKLLAIILIGNNLVNIGASALATMIALQIFGSSGVGIATGVMTLLVLVFGEITPKTFAAQNAEAISLRTARFLEVLGVVFSPVIRILTLITNGIIHLFGGQTAPQGPFVTEEEIRTLVSVGEEEGLIEEKERDMIDSIFEFDDTVVREVMTPRIDMVAIDVKSTLEEVFNVVVEEGHSRIPVYEGNVDNIIGVLYAKDLLDFARKGRFDADLRKLARPAYYIPETKKVNDLLKEMQKAKIHMAIVLDEYGGTAGLVTIEDLLEEIVGDILDEYDEDENLIEARADGSVLVDARVSISEINELMESSLPEEHVDTISGLIYELSGRVPKEGDKVRYGNIEMTVIATAGRRISKVLLQKLADNPAEEGEKNEGGE